MKRIAIIGGGFSGSCLAAHLLRRDEPIEIFLCERRPPVAAGVAYGTEEPEHLLNVPCGKMGLWADLPDDFLRWAGQTGLSSDPYAFLPRRLYARYLAATLENVRVSARRTALHLIKADATSLLPLPRGWRVGWDGLIPDCEVDLAVLATGVGTPSDPCGLLQRNLPKALYLHDPWQKGALREFAIRGNVLLLGSGLTMVDTALVLAARHPEIHLEVLSPHGQMPQAHSQSAEEPIDFPAPDSRQSLREWVKSYRRWQAFVILQGRTWRVAFDALRPYHRRIWEELSPTDRRRFLRHLRPLWNIHRHRMPASSAATLEGWQAAGRLHLHAGKVRDIVQEDEALAIRIHLRGGNETTLQVSHLINCCGQETDCGHGGHPLLRQLLAEGLVSADPLQLGLQTAPDGALIDRTGAIHSDLFAIGSMRRAAEWESTAVPELRNQAAELARVLSMNCFNSVAPPS